MGVEGVRLYHDQALYKEAGGGHTPWHADQYYWPLATDRCCTAWVPLQDTPLEMGPLAFSAGSHRVEVGRDLPISDESEAEMAAALERAALPTVEEPFALGDVSFHSGWTFHRAGPNRTERTREVMTVIYMDTEDAPRRAEEPQPGDRPGRPGAPARRWARRSRRPSTPSSTPEKRHGQPLGGLAVTTAAAGGQRRLAVERLQHEAERDRHDDRRRHAVEERGRVDPLPHGLERGLVEHRHAPEDGGVHDPPAAGRSWPR